MERKIAGAQRVSARMMKRPASPGIACAAPEEGQDSALPDLRELGNEDLQGLGNCDQIEQASQSMPLTGAALIAALASEDAAEFSKALGHLATLTSDHDVEHPILQAMAFVLDKDDEAFLEVDSRFGSFVQGIAGSSLSDRLRSEFKCLQLAMCHLRGAESPDSLAAIQKLRSPKVSALCFYFRRHRVARPALSNLPS